MFGNGARMDTHADASQFRVELSMPWVTEHNT
jgi:hypothetical protein